MKLSSARDLKVELRQRLGSARLEKRAFSIRGLGDYVVDVPRPVAALGVSPMAGPRQYALAIRVFRGRETEAAPVLRRVAKLGRELNLATGVHYRPRLTIRAGGSCGHHRITAGTLGGFVEDDDGYYVLSNNHVLANSDAGAVGDPILAPGPADIHGRYAVIANLDRWVPLRRAGSFDAAVAELGPAVKHFYPWHYQNIGTMARSPVGDRYATLDVVKRGRTTNVTKGRVSAFELDDVAIDYGSPGRPKLVTFNDQIEIVGAPNPRSTFSEPGDSGSFILDARTLEPYALLYGGGPDDQGIDRTLGQFMPDVLNSLGVWLVQ